jgi:hypothetical protein
MASASILLAGCKPNLDVTNPNEPDVARALASPEDVQSLAISSVHSWYLSSTNYEPYAFLQTTSDVLTANFGNFGMRFNNLEPRIAYANNSAGGDRGVTETPWNDYYGTLGAANDAVRAFKSGVKLAAGQAETDKFMRLAQFSQAASLTNLALLFDQSFIVDDQTDPASPPKLSPYKDVSANAVSKWAALAASEAGKTDSYDPTVLPMLVGPLNSSRIARIANTMAALTMAYTPRNAAEAATVNWAQVATYAANGVGTGNAGAPFDMVVIGDYNTWYSNMVDVGGAPSWMRVDLRVINRMDPNTPTKMTTTTPPAKGSSADARFDGDFAYKVPIPGDPARGIFMLSPYYHKRYFDHSLDSPTEEQTPTPYLLAAESDLVRAEALIRSNGDLAVAASLINNTRVTRGHLTAAAAADGATKLLGYIEYERDVELLNTNGWALFQRRHVDGLQAGTVHHLPIPAKELETLTLPVYTFGGPGKEQFLGGFDTNVLASKGYFGPSNASIALPTGEQLPLHFPVKLSRAQRLLGKQ